MRGSSSSRLTDIIGALPYRLQLAGGWIDQPFVSRLDPRPPGSMVVVSLEPTVPFMDRAGMATGTRQVALKLWRGRLPRRPSLELVEALYRAENRGRSEPSGTQDMIGLLYPGVSRLDYDFAHRGGIYPVRIESNNDPTVARWLERVVHLVPVAPRPPGYAPLGRQRLTPAGVRRLGRTGRDCFAAIVARDLDGFGASLNETMRCWAALLPDTVDHPALTVGLRALLRHYQANHPGAMFSGCGGGYLTVVSRDPVPGSISIRVRRAPPPP